MRVHAQIHFADTVSRIAMSVESDAYYLIMIPHYLIHVTLDIQKNGKKK